MDPTEYYYTMTESHHNRRRVLSTRRKTPLRVLFLCICTIIALLLALQFNLIRQTANKYYISELNTTIDQPTNDYQYDAKSSSSPLRRGRHGEVAGGNSKRNNNQKPRVVAIVGKEGEVLPITNAIIPYNLIKISEQDMPDDPPLIDSTWYEPNAAEYLTDKYDLQVCQPMHEWQLQSFPNCNSFHELDLTKLRYITSGTRRSAFELREVVNGRHNPFVYKSGMWNVGINEKRVEMQRVDALVLEKTQSSKFVPDIHGYCSIGILMDYTPGGSLYDYVKGVRLAGGSTLSPINRLRIALHITAGVADLHSIDGSSMPSFYHDDLDWHQYLYVDGIFKLNDFNYAKPIYVKKHNTNEQCTLTKGHMGICKGRSLEEFQAKANYNYTDFSPFRPDTIDIWMMGNLIYTVMTDLYPFEKPFNLNRTETGKKLINGERSEIPEHIWNSHDPSYRAMMEALDMCWTYRWDKRPSARYVTDYLFGELQKITGEENPDVRVTLPERDPDQKNTESDYQFFNDGANDC